MKSSSYWKKREEKAIQERIKFDTDKTLKIKRMLDQTMKDIEQSILADMSRYSLGTSTDFPEVMKRVSDFEVKEFSNIAKQMVKGKDFSKQANSLLKVYNLKMRINRLEYIKAKIGLATVSLGEDLIKYFDEVFTEAVMNELQRDAGILNNATGSPGSYLKQARRIVDDSSFVNAYSHNIWSNTQLLQLEVEKLLFKHLATGSHSRTLAAELRKSFDVSKYQAERLMRTEVANAQINAQKDSYSTNEIDMYEFIAEPSACKLCKPLDGKKFKVKDMEKGKNAPVMHPNCRCSTAPYVDDKAFYDDLLNRGVINEQEYKEAFETTKAANDAFDELLKKRKGK